METYFLKNEDIIKFYEQIASRYELYIPFKIKSSTAVKCEYSFNLPCDDYVLRKYNSTDKDAIIFNEYRCIEPAARVFFTQVKEEVCGYFKPDKKPDHLKPVAICGIKNCDLFAMQFQDYVFLSEEKDPVYRARREDALIICGDCTNFKEACFCRSFDINPHAEKAFDFNLSPLNNGFLVDVASVKARKIIEPIKDLFVHANLGQLSGRSSKREAVIRRIDEHLFFHKIPKKESLQDIVLSGYSSPIWQEQMCTCVECGGCIFICDTCHCFLLADQKEAEYNNRIRVWDGCLLKNFSRVAGGANPLKMRYMRLRNRYLKKFDFFISNMGIQACCGCGRCIDVCPGKIDIRYILRKLYEEKYLPAK